MRRIYAPLTAALLLSASPALAAPVDDFVSTLKDYAKQTDASLTVGETEDNGANFVLKDVVVENENISGKVAETRVEGYNDTEEFTKADKLYASGMFYTVPEMGLTVSADTLEMTKVELPTGDLVTFNTNGVWKLAASQLTKDIAVTLNDKQVFHAPAFAVDNTTDDDGYISKLSAEDMTITLGDVLTGGALETARQMDYETLTANVSGTTRYSPDTGVVESDDTIIAVDNALSYKTSFRFSGYTDQFVKQMAQWDKTYTTPESKNSPEALAKLMPMMKQVKLHQFTVELTDDSLTGKLLDFQAKQMGTTGEQLAEAAPMFIGMSLGQLQMPEFSQMVAEGVSGFLKDKGTLTISVKPEEPVSIAAVVEAAQSDPRQLPGLLGLSVTSTK